MSLLDRARSKSHSPNRPTKAPASEQARLIEQAWRPEEDVPASTPPEAAPFQSAYTLSPRATTQAALMDIDRIKQNPHNARQYFDEDKLKQMAETMLQVGVIHPFTVRPVQWQNADPTKHLFENVAGDRRLLAARMAGLKQVPVTIRFDLQGERGQIEADLLGLIENVTREDLQPTELANGLTALKADMQTRLDAWIQPRLARRKVDVKPGEVAPRVASKLYRELLEEGPPSWAVAALERAAKGDKRPQITWDDIARFVGLSESYLRQMSRLSGLPEDVQDAAKEAGLSKNTLLEIAAAPTPTAQRRLTTMAAKHGKNPAELREARERWKAREDAQREESEAELAARERTEAVRRNMAERDSILREQTALRARLERLKGAETSVWSESWREKMEAEARALLELVSA